jgi:hypothetical protein
VKQSQDDADHGTLGLELPQCIDLPLVTHEQARHRQGDIERVLAVVIDRIDAGVTGHAARKQRVEIAEGPFHGREHDLRPGRDQQLFGRPQNLLGRTDTHRVSDVEVAATDAAHVYATICRRPESLVG